MFVTVFINMNVHDEFQEMVREFLRSQGNVRVFFFQSLVGTLLIYRMISVNMYNKHRVLINGCCGVC